MSKEPIATLLLPTVRLDGQTFSSKGLVQVYYNNTWGWVCDQHWDKLDADVVCRELGFTKATLVYSGSSKEDGTTWMNNLQCNGNEKSLVMCFHEGWKSHSCKIGQLAGVVCSIPKGRSRIVSVKNRDILAFSFFSPIPFILGQRCRDTANYCTVVLVMKKNDIRVKLYESYEHQEKEE